MKISVAIIVKNEEDIIRRCLNCVSKFADQIVVVDTGSTDKTKEIINEEYSSVELYDSKKFNKDTHFSDFEFGTAKNEAVDRCVNPWVIWWDADDFMDDASIDKIKITARDSALDVIYDFRIVFGTSKFYHSRMLPNGKGIRFDEDHSCHEFLTAKKGIRRFKRDDIKIQHLPGKKGGLPSAERNVKIMEKDYYVKGRKDSRTLFYLANSYRELKNNKEAIKFYEEYLSKSKWKEERLFARYYKSRCHFMLEENRKAVNEALMAITEDDRFAEPYCFLGDMYSSFGKYEKAKAWYTMAKILKSPPKDSVLFVMPNLYSDYPKKKIKDCDNAISKKLFPEENKDVKKKSAKIDEKIIGIEVLASPDGQLKSALAIDSFVRNFPHVKVKPVVSKGKLMNSIFDKMDNIYMGKEDVCGTLKIEVPSNLKNKNSVEWMSRSLGFVPKGINSSHSYSELKKDPKKILLVTEVEGGEEWPSFKWELLAEKLEGGGYDVKYYNDFILDEKDCNYGLVVGQASIAPSLSKLINTKAIIIHPDMKSVENFSYDGQLSIVQKINKITVNEVFERVENFLVEVK
jgi:glycosyltransferase involved in cell wall biosynthesis